MALSADVDIQPFDLGRTFFLQRFGLYDPTVEATKTSFRKAFMGKNGVCVVHVSASVNLNVSGADAEGVLADLSAALRTDDGHDAFAPANPLIAKLHRLNRGLRIVRVPWRFDVACGTVLQQRVTVREAIQQWSRIAKKYGERAEGLVAFPSAERLSHMASWRLEELGVDPKRTRAMLTLARDVHRRSLFDSTDVALVRKHMMALRGIGPWTTETTLGYGFGDPDAVPTADLHLPHLVTWALAREPCGTDERMLELLEPFRGQRFRALRLLQMAGISVPIR